MWHGNTLYFLSDRGADAAQQHLGARHRRAGKRCARSRTSRDFDITFPSIGPMRHRVPGGRPPVSARSGDREGARGADPASSPIATTLQPRTEKADDAASATRRCRRPASAPSSRRAATSSPCRPSTAPVLNVTRTSGVAERYPRWSPDGKTLAYWSDRIGRVRADAAAGRRQPAPNAGDDARAGLPLHAALVAGQQEDRVHRPGDADSRLRHRARASRPRSIESPLSGSHGDARGVSVPLVARLALAHLRAAGAASGNNAIFLYDTKAGASCIRLTSGYFNDAQPVFDPEGKYLFYCSDRNFEPVYSDFDNSLDLPERRRSIVAVPLRADVPSPLAPSNDAETATKDEGRGKKDEAKKDEATKDEGKKDDGPGTKDEKKDEGEGRRRREGRRRSEAGARDDRSRGLRGARRRAAAEGRQLRADLQAIKGKLLYRRTPRTGSGDEKSRARLLRSRGARREDRARRRRRRSR